MVFRLAACLAGQSPKISPIITEKPVETKTEYKDISVAHFAKKEISKDISQPKITPKTPPTTVIITASTKN